MSERDEITTSEGVGSRRRNTAMGVGGEVTQSERDVAEHERQRTQLRQADVASEPTPKVPAEVSADITSIKGNIENIRTKAATFPNSDALAAVLQAVAKIEEVLPVIAQGLADVSTSMEEVPHEPS